jgi:predicted SnoaL-like aldol condensation-catalyzing enzyme
MTEPNTAVVQNAVDGIWNRGDLAIADRLFAQTYVNHGGIISDLVRGPEAIKISVAVLRTAFPSLAITIERLTADGDTVDVCWAADSPSDGPPTTGTRSTGARPLRGTTRSTLVDGKITESWTDWDHASALKTLNVIAPEAPA